MKVEFYRHALDEADIANVVKVLNSVFLSTGPVTAEFERKFSHYTGLEHVVAVNSCTSAMHMALVALGVGPGDEVIVPAMTFLSTASAVMHAGATPVIVDVDAATGLVTPEAIEKAVTPRTKAVIPVHLYGTLCDMPSIKALADKHGLYIIEDCAHCVEGQRDGYRPGHLGTCACYSFYATKNLTCGEGGAFATSDPDLAARVRMVALHGMSKGAADRYHKLYTHYDLERLGWKCNLDDIHAALLVGQIDRLDSLWEKRHALWKRYADAFDRHPRLGRPEVVGKCAHHLYTIWTDPARRDATLHALQQRGIGVAVNFRAIHLLSYFKDTFGFGRGDFPNAEAIGDRTITLPFYTQLRDEQVDYVIEQVLEVTASS
ncbi:DegT/DnrJ/EryC1/StrS family aminotransferase [Fundidesulfovibrio terrae]|uniref:DegT/DnrJ/EryC1/StrS family aminotransferase n=1 Tax=Fundidesulfovibrio terrae TaxID=2922866 RepID=UPI001FAEC28A|nr:DegT/DnrJ/EryC1/StrS aminotransferase family protein [Fundidesulfovibrio terrae]